MDGMKAIDIRKRAEMNNRAFYQQRMNEAIKYEIARNFKTTFIGSVDIIDKKLGVELWGFGKDPEDLTDDELYWREIRDEVRKLILDNGNKQLRLAQEALDKYNLEEKKIDRLPTMTMRSGK